jgi:hypothetical protein
MVLLVDMFADEAELAVLDGKYAAALAGAGMTSVASVLAFNGGIAPGTGPAAGTR